MDALRKFIAFTKADEASRTVEGLMTAELPDKSDEIFDYASSVPYVKAWSDEAAKATGDSSLGNVREMHSLIAAGKLTELNFHDAQKAITVKAKIVDDSTWKKVQERVLRGFSIGGSYIKKWKDGAYTRFTADISEVSVVDNPALKEAVIDFGAGAMPGKCDFVFAKADGSGFAAKFSGGMEALSKADVDRIAEGVAEALAKKGKEPYGDVEYADPGYQSDKKKRYPLDTEEHVRAAWSYINMPKNSKKYSAEQLAHIKGKIRAAMRRHGIEESKEAGKARAAISGTIAAAYEFIKSLESAEFEGLAPETFEELGALVRALEDNSMTAEELEKAKHTMSALHGHIAKAHAHHEKMVAHHEKMGEMHKAHAEHLKNALECCKGMMGDTEKTAAAAVEAELKKAAPDLAPAPAIAPAPAMTKEEIQKAIDAGVDAALKAASDPSRRVHLVPRDPKEAVAEGTKLAPGDGELSKSAVGF